MKVVKILMIGIAMTLIAINLNLSKQNGSFSSLNIEIKKATANPEDPPPTVWVNRQTRYDCIYYAAGLSFGCTNCAWDCEPNEYPAEDPPVENCSGDRTCCDAVATWEALWGPC